MTRQRACYWEEMGRLAAWQEYRVHFHTSGFRKALREFRDTVKPDDGATEAIDAWLGSNKIVPDGWAWYEGDGKTWLIALEVENTNPMTEDKMLHYEELWAIFGDHYFNHDFELVVTNRYGTSVDPVNLRHASMARNASQ